MAPIYYCLAVAVDPVVTDRRWRCYHISALALIVAAPAAFGVRSKNRSPWLVKLMVLRLAFKEIDASARLVITGSWLVGDRTGELRR
jgi:hypothetical protein